MRTTVIGLICAGLLVFALGCPHAEKDTTAQSDNQLPATTVGDAAADEVQAANTETAEAGAPATESDHATAPEAAPEAAAPESAKQITGTWLALFGRADQGVNEQAYLNGHQLQFNEDGTLVLTLIKDGKPGRQMLGSYTIENGRLEWSYLLAEALDTSAIDYAPLGMGRDEEIGLLNREQEGMGRDDEIGLLRGEKEGLGRDAEIGLGEGKHNSSQPSTEKHTEELRIVLDGPFMALTDDHGQIYVYGNLDSRATKPLSGRTYNGVVAGKQIQVAFIETAGLVEGRLGEYGGTFKGTAADGFITGRIEGQPRLSLAALILGPDGALSGVLLTDPYAKLDPQFDFKPQN